MVLFSFCPVTQHSLANGLAAMLAMEHINARTCSIVDGCADRLGGSTDSEAHVSVNMVMFSTQGQTDIAVSRMQSCITQEKAAAVVALPMVASMPAMSLVSGAQGIPVVGSCSQQPCSSPVHGLSVLTHPSGRQHAQAWVDIMHVFGWSRAGVIHSDQEIYQMSANTLVASAVEKMEISSVAYKQGDMESFR